jgi:2-iminobutanoate/2-iminopropanoate deaminase
MTPCTTSQPLFIDFKRLTDGEREELIKLGLLAEDGKTQDYVLPAYAASRAKLEKRLISAPEVLNEAFHYAKPSSFARGLRIDIGGYTLLLISGTASIDEGGKTIHIGDFGAQCWRTYRNIATLLKAENATWHDVIRTTCYLRDIERDYDQFNRIRTSFFHWLGLDPLPASVGVQTRLCREDLLVEIEAVALFPTR